MLEMSSEYRTSVWFETKSCWRGPPQPVLIYPLGLRDPDSGTVRQQSVFLEVSRDYNLTHTDYHSHLIDCQDLLLLYYYIGSGGGSESRS